MYRNISVVFLLFFAKIAFAQTQACYVMTNGVNVANYYSQTTVTEHHIDPLNTPLYGTFLSVTYGASTSGGIQYLMQDCTNASIKTNGVDQIWIYGRTNVVSGASYYANGQSLAVFSTEIPGVGVAFVLNRVAYPDGSTENIVNGGITSGLTKIQLPKAIKTYTGNPNRISYTVYFIRTGPINGAVAGTLTPMSTTKLLEAEFVDSKSGAKVGIQSGAQWVMQFRYKSSTCNLTPSSTAPLNMYLTTIPASAFKNLSAGTVPSETPVSNIVSVDTTCLASATARIKLTDINAPNSRSDFFVNNPAATNAKGVGVAVERQSGSSWIRVPVRPEVDDDYINIPFSAASGGSIKFRSKYIKTNGTLVEGPVKVQGILTIYYN